MTKPRNVKWLLFDQAGVLVYPLFRSKPIYLVNGRRYSSDELYAIFSSKEYHAYNLGHTSERELIIAFIKGKGITEQEFKKVLIDSIEPIPGMMGTIDRLSKHYNLALLTNEGIEWAKLKMEISGFGSYFPHQIVSGEIHLEKPDPAYFKAALRMLNAACSECLFIDDNPANCDGAIKAGIDAVLFRNAESLQKELKGRGIY